MFNTYYCFLSILKCIPFRNYFRGMRVQVTEWTQNYRRILDVDARFPTEVFVHDVREHVEADVRKHVEAVCKSGGSAKRIRADYLLSFIWTQNRTMRDIRVTMTDVRSVPAGVLDQETLRLIHGAIIELYKYK